ncbi:MAG: type III pantothenate kinase [Planctomycetota bacterium]|nr:type III pantothenate kinase [Planctomycetota bacterium]
MGDRVRGAGQGVHEGLRDPGRVTETEPFLTVDLGNTRCKVREWRLGTGDPELAGSADFEGELRLVERVARWLATRAPAGRAALSNVASDETAERMAGVLRAHIEGELLRLPETGLEILCRAPETVGRDRLYTALGALLRAGRSTLVVDAGTALTVDAVVAAGPAAAAVGSFLGGAIAPGPELLARALAEGAERLFEVRPRPGSPALGRDSRSAMEGGVAVGFRGAARELVEAVSRDAHLAAAPVVLTGGARNFLLEPEPFTRRELLVVPELVHLGLIAAAQRACAP